MEDLSVSQSVKGLERRGNGGGEIVGFEGAVARPGQGERFGIVRGKQIWRVDPFKLEWGILGVGKEVKNGVF